MVEHTQRGEPITPAAFSLPAARLAGLYDLIPEAFSEGKVDWPRLRAALGDAVDDRPERYTFSWAGRRAAMQSLQAPPAGALAPCVDQSIAFDATRNIFIEGDNLEALKLLYKAYFGRVKMIYIDPPYNTGNDFIYPDNYADPLDSYLRLTGQKDSAGNLLTSNPETSGRYHSAWLTMIYPRLVLARELLRDDGVIFVSIDDHEVHNLRMVMNEVFGEENFVADISVVNNLKGRNDKKHIATAHEHLLMYAMPAFASLGLQLSEKQLAEYSEADETGEPYDWRDLRKRGGADTRTARPNLYFPLYANASTGEVALQPSRNKTVVIYPLKSDGTEGCWRWKAEKIGANLDIIRASKVEGKIRWNVSYRVYLRANGKMRVAKPKSIWLGSQYSTDSATKTLRELIPGDWDFTPKADGFLRAVADQSTEEDDIILDFFAGSCTTAQAVLQLNREDGGNRRFIMVQLPEPTGRADYPTIAAIGKERIRRVIAKMQAENAGKLDLQTRDQLEDLGFRVFTLGLSAFTPWQGVAKPTAEDYGSQMALALASIDQQATPQRILWEVALREGYSLDATVATLPGLAHNIVYQVTDLDKEQSFLICLDDHLYADTPAALPLRSGQSFICRDAALTDDLAANLALQCRLKTI